MPVLDPRTLKPLSLGAGAPTRLIWVSGEASSEPGSGETATPVPGKSAERSSTAGAQRGPGRTRRAG
jgi:hypothetical protein